MGGGEERWGLEKVKGGGMWSFFIKFFVLFS